jgi:CBS domain-containing protein
MGRKVFPALSLWSSVARMHFALAGTCKPSLSARRQGLSPPELPRAPGRNRSRGFFGTTQPANKDGHVVGNEKRMELIRNLKVDSVSRLHPTPARHVTPEQSVAEAVAVMRQHRVGCVLVCRDDQLLGLFTERDLMRRVLAAGRPLDLPMSAVMTPKPVVVSPKDSIGSAIRRMEEGGYRHLPVIDEGGRPVGVLSVKRIVHYLVEHFPTTVYNLPPDPSVFPREAEGA